MPDEKPLPAPVSTPMRSSSSASSASSASAMPWAIAPFTALRASGRLRVIRRTPSRRSVRTACSSSLMPATLGDALARRLHPVALDDLLRHAPRERGAYVAGEPHVHHLAARLAVLGVGVPACDRAAGV